MTRTNAGLMGSMRGPLKGLLVLLVLLLYAVLETRPIAFVFADLGRHLRNGQQLAEHGTIVDTNYYSYTEPDRKVINHHWLSGLVFYGIWERWDFKGLSLFYLLLTVGAVSLFLSVAYLEAGFSLAVFSTVLSIPLLLTRTEIRPEGFSYFKETYLPMQLNEEIWEEASRNYQFNAIYFFRGDQSAAAQSFLVRRIKDPAWSPIYVDGVAIILVRRNERNRELVQRYDIPQRRFQFR